MYDLQNIGNSMFYIADNIKIDKLNIKEKNSSVSHPEYKHSIQLFDIRPKMKNLNIKRTLE